MASILLKLTTTLLLLSLHSHSAFSSNDIEDDEDEQYVVDSPLANLRSRSRFLATVIKKGTHCDPIAHNVCNGISANKGASLLRCCKKHCRNVLGDKNNCGRCGNKCKHGQRCCSGTCVNTAYNVKHCGKCNKKCKRGHKCEYGYCGYA
ncbi:protein GRIM REAPER-like [Alnus glutinosa]|uniref:protein GRIM REAPER-like n=1 Tax=Alnus glutinosa TaxID=3517 RepID=UPI002D78F930|nr:protein GRIM REAPER-like [Alnus glutinosa]